jgi:hypothetical protein
VARFDRPISPDDAVAACAGGTAARRATAGHPFMDVSRAKSVYSESQFGRTAFASRA